MAQRPTPLSVAVCTLIALHSNPTSRIYRNGDDEQSGGEHLAKVIKHFVLNQQDGQEKHLILNFSDKVFRDKGIPCNLESMTLKYFLRIVAGSDGQYYNMAKFLLDDLNQTASSIDSLFDLYSALRSTVAKGCIDSDSAHGIYVRKRCLGFEQLQFDSVGRFWEALVAYVEAASGWDSCYRDRNKSDSSLGRHNVSSFANETICSLQQTNPTRMENLGWNMKHRTSVVLMKQKSGLCHHIRYPEP
jgi:hypothetical protein